MQYGLLRAPDLWAALAGGAEFFGGRNLSSGESIATPKQK
jgi:hypothetical protein